MVLSSGVVVTCIVLIVLVIALIVVRRKSEDSTSKLLPRERNVVCVYKNVGRVCVISLFAGFR